MTKVYQYYLSFERVHLDNFLLGIQSFQCWTGPEMIVPLLVLTVKNQEMVYNPKITRKQHKIITFYLNVGYPIKNGKKKSQNAHLCCLLNISNYTEKIKFETGVRNKEI